MKRSCLVCYHPDRGLIENLLAAGIFYTDVADEFGVQKRTLQRHETFHSTKQASVDPLSILRHMRLLNEQATVLTQSLLRSGAGQKRSKEIYHLRMESIRTSLAVVSEYAKITNVKKHIDPLIVLPRWHETINRIGNALKAFPEAQAALFKAMKEEGPEDGPGDVKELSGLQEPE